ncbi:MAG TPA: hypothetical protein VKX35_08675 [Fermentimonas sp.]|nr:hypothetical protein [Fermentimonas sp.]
MKKISVLSLIALMFFSCGASKNVEVVKDDSNGTTETVEDNKGSGAQTRGSGKSPSISKAVKTAPLTKPKP